MTPGARCDIVALEGFTVRARVTALPAHGAANDALLDLRTATLKRPRRDLPLLRGAAARIERIAIAPH